MKTIYKYPLTFQETQTVMLPVDSKVLRIALQNNEPMLWALVDTAKIAMLQTNIFHCFVTGGEVHEPHGIHVDTVFLRDLVLHFFMELR